MGRLLRTGTHVVHVIAASYFLNHSSTSRTLREDLMLCVRSQHYPVFEDEDRTYNEKEQQK